MAEASRLDLRSFGLECGRWALAVLKIDFNVMQESCDEFEHNYQTYLMH
jgi:hypothetical protein